MEDFEQSLLLSAEVRVDTIMYEALLNRGRLGQGCHNQAPSLHDWY
jgi:hypothetical protein